MELEKVKQRFRLQGISNRVSQYDLKKKINQSNQKEKMANQYTGGKWNVYDNQMDVLDKTRISTARSLIFEFRFRKF
jgi:hypothetical protein